MRNRKLIGLMAFCVALGMVIAFVVVSRVALLFIMALLLLLGYSCCAEGW